LCLDHKGPWSRKIEISGGKLYNVTMSSLELESDLSQKPNFGRIRIPERDARFNVIVVGGGITGLSCARDLGKAGIETAVIEKEESMGLKSLFVQGKVLQKHGLLEPLLADDGALFPVNGLYIESADTGQVISRPGFADSQPEQNFYAVEYPPLVAHLRQEAQKAPSITILMGETASRVEEFDDEVVLTLAGGERLRADYLVDASGEATFSRSKVKGENGDNPIVLWIYGHRAFGEFDEDTLLDPIGKDIGRGSWILPYSGSEADVIAADYCRLDEIDSEREVSMYQRFRKYVDARKMCRVKSEEELIRGFIRLEPIPAQHVLGTRRIFPLGAAAGMGSPLMGEVIPPCLEWGAPLSEILKRNATPWEFYQTWRFSSPSFPYDKEMTMLRMRLRNPQAGTNFPVYRTVLRWLPEKAQREVLLRRKIPWPYHLPFFLGILTSPESTKYLLRFAREYLCVKSEGKRKVIVN